MFNIAICDDLKEDRELMVSLINGMSQKVDLKYDYTISMFTCGEDLESHYKVGKTAFDIIFLDIYMDGKNGIETARQIRKHDSRCKIIFTSASRNHALESYNVFAYNYIVKPITTQVFASVFKRATEDAYTERKRELCVKSGNKVVAIQYKDIKHVESKGKIARIFTRNGEEITCYLKLDEIESMLSDMRFLRCHKSFLVNMDYITSVQEYFFTLEDGINVAIRQKGYSDIKKKYYGFIIERMG